MSRFCRKHIKERTEDELRFAVDQNPSQKVRELAAKELEERKKQKGRKYGFV